MGNVQLHSATALVWKEQQTLQKSIAKMMRPLGTGGRKAKKAKKAKRR